MYNKINNYNFFKFDNFPISGGTEPSKLVWHIFLFIIIKQYIYSNIVFFLTFKFNNLL